MRKIVKVAALMLSVVSLSSWAAGDDVLYREGKQLYERSCSGCHGTDGKGDIGRPLAGQELPELVKKMKDYKAGRHTGFNASLMTLRAKSLSDEQIRAVALYISRDLKI